MSRTFAFLSTAIFFAAPAVAVDVAVCGQIVPSREIGVLTGNLTCTGGYGVQLERGATLDLAGFTLDMSGDGPPLDVAVFCAFANGEHTKCRVTSSAGPGTISGDSSVYAGVFGDAVSLDNVVVDGFHSYGVYGDKRVLAEDTTVSNTTGTGIISSRRVRASRVTLVNNGSGIFARVVRVSAVDGSGNGDGIAASSSVVGEQVNLTAGTVGIRSLRSLRLRSSNVDGNGIDLASSRRPSVKETSCSISRQIIEGQISTSTWGSCPGE